MKCVIKNIQHANVLFLHIIPEMQEAKRRTSMINADEPSAKVGNPAIINNQYTGSISW